MSNVTCSLKALEITLEARSVARQAAGAVLVRARNAVVLGTVVHTSGGGPTEFLPLTIEYREKAAAFGRIPGGNQRRDLRLSEREVLVSRLIDRAVRPLFAAGFQDEIQVQVQVLSGDDSVNLPTLGLLAASAALMLSPLPFFGPVAGFSIHAQGTECDLGLMPAEDAARPDFDLFFAACGTGITMLEGAGSLTSEEDLHRILRMAEEQVKPLLLAQEELLKAEGIDGRARSVPTLGEPSDALRTAIDAALSRRDKVERQAALASLRQSITPLEAFAFDSWVKERLREQVRTHRTRLDGRAPDEIRTFEIVPSWLPTPHGSALFTRGRTQVSVTCTLGPRGSELLVDLQNGAERRAFFVHYNFPPYSVGELKALRGPARREQGHGQLAYGALAPVMPRGNKNPFVVRLEADVLESDGSSSMATVCAGTLALLDAQVPIQEPIVGIAMGLFETGAERILLSDLLGEEDLYGDLDFKLAGSKSGVSALQMDTKIANLNADALMPIMEAARAGRQQILERMTSAIEACAKPPKADAPCMRETTIAPHLVRVLIGPKGSNIKGVQSRHSVDIRVDDSGAVSVFGQTDEAVEGALVSIQDLVGTVSAGNDYDGTVVKIVDAGAFIRIYESAEGWLHVSEWEEGHTPTLRGLLEVGQSLRIRVLGVDDRGRIRVSRRVLLKDATPASDPVA